MLQILPIRRSRPRAALASMMLAAYGLAWTASPQGTLAITPLTAAAHDVSIRLADGHVDLVLLHSHESAEGERRAERAQVFAAHPSRDRHDSDGDAAGHVVHLCKHDAATTAKTSASAGKSPAPGSTGVRAHPLAQSPRAPAPSGSSPASPLLLRLRTTVLLI